MASDNTKYADRLFNFMFGSEENKAWTLSLYNAINGSLYTDPGEIEIATIKEVMYLGMHNDVSFLICNEINLYEQQSTYNPNMPMRMLQYTGNLFEKYVKRNRLNKFGDKLLSLPVPKLVVFYNGKKEQPEEQVLKLSDSFPIDAYSDIEVWVRMVNINHGKNQILMDSCKPLAEYSWLVEQIRKNKETEIYAEDGSSAIDRAISTVPDAFIIKPFLVAHRAEVKGMLLTEYDEAEQMELFREDGWRDGHAEGREEGVKIGEARGGLKMLYKLVKDGVLTLEQGAREADLTPAEFKAGMP